MRKQVFRDVDVWEKDGTTSLESAHIANLEILVEHEDSVVVVDPEDGHRWALCWLRMPESFLVPDNTRCGVAGWVAGGVRICFECDHVWQAKNADWTENCPQTDCKGVGEPR
tara:strand:+ start:471 stop:806 length:336 start_codon:yes stop_codon:yes gene_type:complete